MIERKLLKTNITLVSSKAKAIEHQLYRQDFNKSSNKLETI